MGPTRRERFQGPRTGKNEEQGRTRLAVDGVCPRTRTFHGRYTTSDATRAAPARQPTSREQRGSRLIESFGKAANDARENLHAHRRHVE